MPAATSSGLRATVRGIWQRNEDLLRNAGSLAGTTGLTSLFGFVYWIVAAKEFSQQAVGYGSAAVSAMMLLGTIGEFGVGTMLIGELPKRRDGGGLTAAAIVASGVGSLVLGVGFPLVANEFGAHFPQISGTPARIGLFAVGVALTGMAVVFDDATIGLLRGGVQLGRNLAMSVIKLALLPVAAVILHDAFGVGLVFSWVAGTLLSFVPALFMLKRGGAQVFHRPDWALLRRYGKLAMAHNWLNLAIMAPPRLIPVLVTVVVSASANASFYVAWMLASFLFMVPSSLSVVLFAMASAAPEVVAEKLRFVLRLSLIIGIPAMAVLAFSGQLVLKLFGATYAHQATIPLLLLLLTYIPGLPKVQYIAVCRATGRVGRATIVLSVAACLDVASVVVGGKIGGLDGVALGYLIMQVVEGLYTAPTVLRAASIRRRAAATGAQPILQSSYTDRQRTALAALIAVASVALSEGKLLDAATEVWGTGSMEAITGSFRAVTGSSPVLTKDDEESYGNRQRAGLDVLLSIATPDERRSRKQRLGADPGVRVGEAPNDSGGSPARWQLGGQTGVTVAERADAGPALAQPQRPWGEHEAWKLRFISVNLSLTSRLLISSCHSVRMAACTTVSNCSSGCRVYRLATCS
jgi:O-antigen/teichoic acid export membrane protein